jgi:hypothetical protein
VLGSSHPPTCTHRRRIRSGWPLHRQILSTP